MGFYKSKVRERERIYHKIKTIKLKYAIILLCKIIAILSKNIFFNLNTYVSIKKRKELKKKEKERSNKSLFYYYYFNNCNYEINNNSIYIL